MQRSFYLKGGLSHCEALLTFAEFSQYLFTVHSVLHVCWKKKQFFVHIPASVNGKQTKRLALSYITPFQTASNRWGPAYGEDKEKVRGDGGS